MQGDYFDEYKFGLWVDRARREQDHNRGLSFKTIAAFGKNAALPIYHAKNDSSSVEITDHNLILIDSGGQYLGGNLFQIKFW
jgi:Xaa-Pro aminopeptidase